VRKIRKRVIGTTAGLTYSDRPVKKLRPRPVQAHSAADPINTQQRAPKCKPPGASYRHLCRSECLLSIIQSLCSRLITFANCRMTMITVRTDRSGSKSSPDCSWLIRPHRPAPS
jgi:hypothetical protein